MKNGIYFNLDETIYHDIQRLSSSAICKLRISPPTFWHGSWLNPNPKLLTPAQEKAQELARFLGKAYHCARLEPEKFTDLYCRELSQTDFDGQEGFLTTGDQIKKELEALGLAKTGKVLDQAQRLAAAGYASPIWHIELENWQASIGSKIPIKAEFWDDIIVDMERIRKIPIINDKLSGGCAEVSILWTDDNGTDLKARFDYLRPDMITDFKTFANSQGKHILQCITEAIDYNRYYIQAALYLSAAEQIRNGTLEIIGDANHHQAELIKAIKSNPNELEWHWVFQEKSGVPNIITRRLQFYEIPHDVQQVVIGLDDNDPKKNEIIKKRRLKSLLLQKAQGEINKAIQDFNAYSDMYSVGEPWFPAYVTGDITDADFNPYRLENINS